MPPLAGWEDFFDGLKGGDEDDLGTDEQAEYFDGGLFDTFSYGMTTVAGGLHTVTDMLYRPGAEALNAAAIAALREKELAQNKTAQREAAEAAKAAETAKAAQAAAAAKAAASPSGVPGWAIGLGLAALGGAVGIAAVKGNDKKEGRRVKRRRS